MSRLFARTQSADAIRAAGREPLVRTFSLFLLSSIIYFFHQPMTVYTPSLSITRLFSYAGRVYVVLLRPWTESLPFCIFSCMRFLSTCSSFFLQVRHHLNILDFFERGIEIKFTIEDHQVGEKTKRTLKIIICFEKTDASLTRLIDISDQG